MPYIIPFTPKQRETVGKYQATVQQITAQFQAFLSAIVQGQAEPPSDRANTRLVDGGIEITEPEQKEGA